MGMKKYPDLPILVVDDEKDILASYKMVLHNAGINHLLLCDDSRQVMKLLGAQPVSVIVLDLIMPDISGRVLLEEITEKYPGIPVIVVTGSDEVDTAVACMKLGAFDYMVKSVDNVRLSSGVRRAIEMCELQNQVSSLTHRVFSSRLKHPEAFRGIITQNDAMNAIFRYVEAVAGSPKPVLISGESGTGKDLLARSIHDLSGCSGEFVTVNAGGIDDIAFSDTLFGHRKGAFTGAVDARKGLIVQASGGTLFLDEIGELEAGSQIKLLRLLQNREYYALGSDVIKQSDARIIAATNQNLEAKKNEAAFRNDLYYRLSTHRIHLPPLRERKQDIPLLVDAFLEKAAQILNKKKPAVPRELYVLLGSYAFPGNVRELESMIFNAVSTHDSGILSLSGFKQAISNSARSGAMEGHLKDNEYKISYNGRFPTLREVDDFFIAEAMKMAKNNQSIAALHLGISQSTLSRRFRDKETPPEEE